MDLSPRASISSATAPSVGDEPETKGSSKAEDVYKRKGEYEPFVMDTTEDSGKETAAKIKDAVERKTHLLR